MMLPTDIALIQDTHFRSWVEKYAVDQQLFFDDFAAAFGKMLDNGVPTQCPVTQTTAPASKGWWGK
jgi:cytochrome c peroxidase